MAYYFCSSATSPRFRGSLLPLSTKCPFWSICHSCESNLIVDFYDFDDDDERVNVVRRKECVNWMECGKLAEGL